MRYKRNELGLTKKQALFVAYGGMDRTRTQILTKNAAKATRVAARLRKKARTRAAKLQEPVHQSGEFAGLTYSTVEQILALRKYFGQSAK